MNLHNFDTNPKVIERALLAMDCTGIVRILATDSAGIASMIAEVSADAEEIGLVNMRAFPDEAICLWTGTSRLELENYEASYPTEVVYDGTYRIVEPQEIADLYKMSPPEEEEEDGPSPEDLS